MSKRFLTIGAVLLGFVLLGQSCGAPADGGVFRASDDGEFWEQKVFVGQQKKKVITISNVNVQKMVPDPQNSDVIYLATREDGLWKTETKGEQWYQLPLTPDRIRDVAINQSDTNVVYTVRGNTILKSTDGGASWEIVYTDSQGAIITRLVVDWFNVDRVYAVTSIGTVLLSEDAGENWRVIHQVDEPLIGIFMSQDDSRVMYILELDRTVYKSTDGGATWNDIFIEWPVDEKGLLGVVKRLYMNDGNSDDLYLSTTEGLWHSVDGGTSWDFVTTLIARGAPENSEVAAFAVRPDISSTLFFTVGQIIHKSVDSGATWETIETFPSARKITWLQIDRDDPSIMFAGTEFVEEKSGGFIKRPGN